MMGDGKGMGGKGSGKTGTKGKGKAAKDSKEAPSVKKTPVLSDEEKREKMFAIIKKQNEVNTQSTLDDSNDAFLRKEPIQSTTSLQDKGTLAEQAKIQAMLKLLRDRSTELGTDSDPNQKQSRGLV
jgi:hypothetical protein